KLAYGVTSRTLGDATVQGKPQPVARALAALPAGDPAWPREVREHYLAGPRDRRYADLAARVVADALRQKLVAAEEARSPFYQGVLFLLWIRQNTVYSLRPNNGSAADPAAEFLFGNRKGYCQHVAGAMTFLLRSRGIPARVATGYGVPRARLGQGSAV